MDYKKVLEIYLQVRRRHLRDEWRTITYPEVYAYRDELTASTRHLDFVHELLEAALDDDTWNSLILQAEEMLENAELV